MRKTIILLLSLLFVLACSDEFSLSKTDIDLTKDWEEAVGVFSNLNLHNNNHYIRINRGFAGNNFFLHNTNPDSIYFDPSQIDVTLYKIRVHNIFDGEITDADTLGIYECRDTVLYKDANGMFFTEEVPLFYAQTRDFKVTNADDLYVGLEVNTSNRKITSYTKLVPITEFTYPNQFLPKFPIEDFTFDAEIRLPRGSQIFQVEGNCIYKEVTRINGVNDTLTRTFKMNIGTHRVGSPVEDLGVRYKWRVSTELFYGGLEQDVRENGDTINTIARVMEGIYFSAYAGNADLALASTSSIINTGFSDQPANFSNIKNGFGYFSAFIQFNTKKFELTDGTIDSVVSVYGNKYFFKRSL
jgi:hypothetical protein